MIFAILFSFVLFSGFYLRVIGYKRSSKSVEEDLMTVSTLISLVKDHFNNILRQDYYQMNLSKDIFEKQMKRRKQLREALKTCLYGDINAKNYIKSFIKEILLKEGDITEESIQQVIPFNHPQNLNVEIKFLILLQFYEKKYGLKALEKLIVENQLDGLRETEAYYIDEEDIEKAYYLHIGHLLSFQEQLEILVQKIYQQYKGYGPVDAIRDMNIDGISAGVSGVPSNFYQSVDYLKISKENKGLPASYDSIWIFFKGKSVQLRFLTFRNQRELIRVCKNIYKYDNPGQLTETLGYMINKMKDGSRVVVTRPPFSESWAFFLRKFDSLEKIEMKELIRDDGKEIPINFLKFLMKGCQVTAVTGSQGAGKTTLLMALVGFINPVYNLRIQEVAFELHLRSIYPYRNILTFKETLHVSGQEGLDLQKKTDGTVNILGEVATAPVASWMIQMSQVASLFTVFTHHAKTTENLIESLRNNLLQTGMFTHENIAEDQVAKVIDFDIHLEKDQSGHRYIKRITEIIKREKEVPYISYESSSSAEVNFYKTMKAYYEPRIPLKEYVLKDIVVYNDGCYEVKNKLSLVSYKKLLNTMSKKDQLAFNAFIKKYQLVVYE